MVTTSETTLDATGFEIGLYFVVGLIQVFLIMTKIRGKPWRLKPFLASRQF
jgi:hypothetical protein